MKNLINAIELQKEKLEAIKLLLKTIKTDENNQSTSEMLKEMQTFLTELIKTDF